MINKTGVTRILAIQDTSNIYLDDQEVIFERGEIGYLDSSGRSRNGVKLHNTFGLDTEGNILGILDQQIWSRDFKSIGKTKDRAKLPIEVKESYKWITSPLRFLRPKNQGDVKSNIKKLNKYTEVVLISDREGCFKEFMNQDFGGNVKYLVRSKTYGLAKLINVCNSKLSKQSLEEFELNSTQLAVLTKKLINRLTHI